MKILKMSFKGYRNLKENEIEFSPEINFVFGKNAQGKTNLMEAIWMFTGARSFRGTKDVDLVNFNCDFAKIDGKFFFENRNHEITIIFNGGKRKAIFDDVAKNYPTNIIGRFKTVLFSPVHLSLVKDGPDFRRRFLDAAICQLKPTYTKTISKYNQVLKQRNSFLKTFDNTSQNLQLLDVWDDKLSELGAKIIKERIEYLKVFKNKVFSFYSDISGGKEKIEVKYIFSVNKNINLGLSVDDIKKLMFSKLEKTRETDIKTRSTSCGPHKDDLEILINEKTAKNFGSQGQQRSAVLAFKLAEAMILEEFSGEPPVILLDDVMSELDDFRKKYLLKGLGGRQVFITSCDKSDLKKLKIGKLFTIENGEVNVKKDF
ncbi:MAG: DNA replication/repair protein RecF [Clostridia bacterium]|nr:DNA replication/repair protein RecF [Clostridia bacterium]